MDQQLKWTFILFVVYQVKHFIADFPLQREYMLQKVKPGWDFVLPLTMHSGVHGLGTLFVVLVVNPSLWWLGVLDFILHFISDRLKSGPRYLGRFTDMKKQSFWNVLGFDQMVHHITHVYFIYYIIMNTETYPF